MLSNSSGSSARSSSQLHSCELLFTFYVLMLSNDNSPQYYEIYKHKEVVGISIPFMAIDLLGGVFSDLSLVFKENFDVIAGVAYSLVVVSSSPDTVRSAWLTDTWLHRF